MKIQITHIAYHQTSKIMALVSALISVCGFIILNLTMLATHPERFHNAVVMKRILVSTLTLPVLSALLGYVLTLFSCFIYNRIASRFGGIELTLSETPDD